MSVKNNTGVQQGFQITIYIDSAKPRSMQIKDRLLQLCRSHLMDDYKLDIVDLRDDPVFFEQNRIIATPTLDVVTPQNEKHRFVGDLSQSEMFIIALGMTQEASHMEMEAIKMRRFYK